MVESRKPGSDPLDVAGAVTLALGIAALLFAVLQRAGAGTLGTSVRLVLLSSGLVLLAVFVRIEGKRDHPLVPPDLFRHARTAAPYLAGVLLGTTIYGVDTFVPLFVQGARGGTAGAAGAVITPLVFLLGGLGGGRRPRSSSGSASGERPRWGALLILLGFVGLLTRHG